MKKFFISLCALSLVACSSTPDLPEAQDSQVQSVENAPAKLSNSMSLAHKELLEIIAEQNFFFETYKGEVSDKLEFAQMNTKYKKIVSRWQNYISSHPDDIDAIIIYGKFLRAVGEFSTAYVAFMEVDKINPNIAVVKQQLATFEGDFGLYKESLANIDKAIALKGDEVLYYYQKAELLCVYYNEFLDANLFEKAQLNKAIEDNFKAAINLDKNNTHLYWRYAQCFYQQSEANWQSALEAWQMLEDKTYMPLEKKNVLVNKARVLIELFRDEEAMQILDKIDAPSLEQNKNRLINIIKAGKEGDLQAEETLKIQEKESLKAELKEEIKNPHLSEKSSEK